MKHPGFSQPAPRATLLALLDAAASKRVIYMHAPAGYGKTFSIKLWLEHRALPAAWVTVSDSAGSQPAEFCERLVAALVVLQPNNFSLKELFTSASFSAAPFEFAKQALHAFRLYALGQNEAGCTLVIDDVHLVTHPELQKRTSLFVSELPESVTLCILSRTAPPDSFAELLLKDRMALVGMEDLKFSQSEVQAFFALRGQPLTPPQAQEIMAVTDGWAIGLNALTLSRRPDAGAQLLPRYLSTFIREQIWDKWDTPRQDFLLRISVVDDLTPEFCNAVTGRGNSMELLDALVQENVFISADSTGIYRLHHLFRDFLRHMLQNDRRKNQINRRAGDWFFAEKRYFEAVEYYTACGNKKGVAKSFKAMYNRNSLYNAIEEMLPFSNRFLSDSIVEEFPFLLEAKAAQALAEGNAAEFGHVLDKYYKLLPKIILQNPTSIVTSLMLRCADYRKSLIKTTQKMKILPGKKNFKTATATATITFNLPLLHRSFRDLSEYVFDTEKNLDLLERTVGAALGEEFNVIRQCIVAGLHYEKGELDLAHERVLAAVKMQESYPPEIQFCCLMLLAAIADAQGDKADTEKILAATQAMIERHGSYYLSTNFRAFTCRAKFSEGDTEAARAWLAQDAGPPNSSLSLYKVYQHFTTARAYITLGDYGTAILFLQKLLFLCEQFHRPLDVTEANLLLAIALWKKGRGAQNSAFSPLEKAIATAGPFGYTQPFACLGADLETMLHKLQNRVSQKDYDGELDAAYIRTLYYLAVAHSKRSHGLSGTQAPNNLKFTARQKTIMRWLAAGLTQKEIAEKTGLKPSTIKTHMNLIYKKLDVSSAVNAIIRIRELKILEPLPSDEA